jgi:hypothetical protein
MTSKPVVLESLLAAFDRFYETLNAATVPTACDGRRVVWSPHAITLSEAAGTLQDALGAALHHLLRQHGRSVEGYPPGLALAASDSPGGPYTPIPADQIRSRVMEIGGDGADATLFAALLSATKVAGFGFDRWNEMQAIRPGGDHRRFRANDTFSANDLAELESASNLLRLYIPKGNKPVYLEAGEVATLLGLNRGTVTRAARDGKIPAFKGGGPRGNWMVDAEAAAARWSKDAGPLLERIEAERGALRA